MSRFNLDMVRGDTLSFGAKFNGLTEDLDSAYFTIRTTGGTQVTQKSIGSGIEKVATGLYKVRVAPADTANVVPGEYRYDFQVGLGSDIYTLLIGRLMIDQDVTY